MLASKHVPRNIDVAITATISALIFNLFPNLKLYGIRTTITLEG
jgi:hypothetical protein